MHDSMLASVSFVKDMASGRLRPLVSFIRGVQATSTRVSPLLQHGCPHVVIPPPCYVRHYATKKSKAKAKGQVAKVSINAALVEDIISLEEVQEDMATVLATLKEDFSRNLGIRTSPGALDHILVTTKDGKCPLNQLGQISMKSSQLMVVNMTSNPEATAAVTRALQESSMKLNPEVEGTIIRVPIPKVTREHRENLAKLAKEFSNKAKESVRRVRTKALVHIKKAKEGVSEDTVRLIEKQVQQMADSYTADIDKQLATKTKELLG
ncbi:ribosome-recycling factor, mitochondrial isoform X2 [Electrophorus electricus]|uniref:ribosome-recycling factor, mitochondrial isoform X2 n=1 Tax=Electrophorus electricus TaxID=8005 RepID=UPI0015CFFA30|nr:ribosome-recycling factor, mitochondrial isoform X2 [Electrophorus electricus]